MADNFGLTDYAPGSEYAVDGERSGPAFPWIQADMYKPGNLKTEIRLGLPGAAMDMMDQESPLMGALTYTTASFGVSDDEVPFGAFNPGIRWVILCRPKLAGMIKATGDIVPLAKGMKDRGEVTVSRLFLACLIADGFVRTVDGEIQVFTLKLKSSKTAFIGNDRDKDFGQKANADHRTISQLNGALLAHAKGKPGQWLGHTVSVELGAVPEKFTSATASANGKKESSMGIRFVFPADSTAKPLPAALLPDVFGFVTSDSFKELAKNPFGDRLGSAQAEPDTAPDLADMPF
jgi:hypothetical protein